MFCLACGAELAGHLTACPNCGTPVRRAESVNEAEKAAFASTDPPMPPAALAAPGPGLPVAPGVPASPSISEGDLSNSLVPRDTVGRVVLGTTLAMAVDVLAPWVTVGQLQLPLVRLGAPMVLLLLALALPLAALRPTLRRQPTWAALPLTVGAVCLGAGVGMWAVLTWLSPRVAFITTNVSAGAPEPSTLTFTPAIGLYLFLAAAALLALSGYQFFLAARDAQLREAYVVRSSSDIPFPYTLHALQPGMGVAGLGTGAALPINNGLAPAPPETQPAEAQPAETEAAPPAAAPGGATPPAPILPGTAAWNQPREAPTVNRHAAPGAGFPRPLGPRGGR